METAASFKIADVFTYESLIHAVAGSLGSVTAMTVFYQLDSMRLRLQGDTRQPCLNVWIHLVCSRLAPYRGWFPVICSLCCSNFVYFYTFNSVKACWLRGHRSTPGKDLVVGIIAGVVNVLVTTPLWVVNTRLKLQGAKFRNNDIKPTHYSGILDAFHQILLSEGLPALWNGTLPSLLLVLNPALQFMVYEGLKRELRRGASGEFSSLEVFVIGAIAKAVATTATYPLQTVQSILRFGQHRHSKESRIMGSLRSIFYLWREQVRKHGIVGLFKGLEAKLLQTVLTAALMFLLYEKMTAATFRIMGLRRTLSRR
ncbi:hypothetical protein AOXY_G27222 [Acipenser oxyrinchus oxyrinchus]|uniref:Peroxisomal membrane protein PMP34 n=1 Tax=Acipenser oxyrinchus oxyrinchus TaxID=40147 RepID=A0AAD8CPE2_ACIOX|nr:hypothetical protein AOXY_G27222 [Acipenser oxyrinchus oxyrinchus]